LVVTSHLLADLLLLVTSLLLVTMQLKELVVLLLFRLVLHLLRPRLVVRIRGDSSGGSLLRVRVKVADGVMSSG
jgi:hypothetical protein